MEFWRVDESTGGRLIPSVAELVQGRGARLPGMEICGAETRSCGDVVRDDRRFASLVQKPRSDESDLDGLG